MIAEGNARSEKGDYVGAALDLKAVITQDPKNAEAMFGLGRALLGTGDLVDAESSLRRALEFGHPQEKVMPVLGRVLLEREQYDVMLEEQAYPFEEKAIGLHETNAARAPQGLYDRWVR